MERYKTWFAKHKERLIADYITYLKFPSVSAQKQHKSDTLACANWVENYLKNLGFTTTQWKGKGHPTIFGEKKVGEKKPTLLFYGHYDVQPPEPLNLWKSEPFEPEIRNGRMYARGAEDNKGQNFYTLCALEAFMEEHKELPFNIKIVIEGEEEMGSETLLEVLEEHKEEAKADYLFVVDLGMGSWEKPALTLGCRGIMTMEVQCRNSDTDLHSGHYGGIALNPIRALTDVLAQVFDKSGKVTIPGFYDDVKELAPEEKKKIDLSFDPGVHKKEVGMRAFHKVEGCNPTEVSFLQPVFEINGITGGYSGEGFKTVLPAVAAAKLSCRLVPNQDPEKIYTQVCHFIKERFDKDLEITFTKHGGGPAVWSNPLARSIQIAEKAYKEVFGSCHFIYAGGSIPITKALASASGAEVILIGTGLDCDNIHAPNESFGLDQFEKGFLLVTRMLELFSKA
jgi:acetylornithine deacetylase/succinyl-diaminopimelate desuccinylase-like protein